MHSWYFRHGYVRSLCFPCLFSAVQTLQHICCSGLTVAILQNQHLCNLFSVDAWIVSICKHITFCHLYVSILFQVCLALASLLWYACSSTVHWEGNSCKIFKCILPLLLVQKLCDKVSWLDCLYTIVLPVCVKWVLFVVHDIYILRITGDIDKSIYCKREGCQKLFAKVPRRPGKSCSSNAHARVQHTFFFVIKSTSCKYQTSLHVTLLLCALAWKLLQQVVHRKKLQCAHTTQCFLWNVLMTSLRCEVEDTTISHGS